MVRAGRFKKVSASFYTPDSPHNPVPGVYYLRHVGFLGAQPPAVKGLAPVPVNFAEGDTEEGCVSFDFAESPGLLRWLADLFRGFGDSTRIRILYVLFEAEMCVCDIAALLGMAQSAISHQLKALKNARLVKSRRDGKTVFYSLADDHVKTIIDQGLEHILE